MRPIRLEEITALLSPYEGRSPFMHIEVTPGAFVRNVQATVVQAYVRGAGPFRVALRLADDGWTRVEGLTHLTVDEEGRLLMAGHDDKGRLTCALQLSLERFPA
ncbi:DUF1806 family protein [Paenibacillus arenilitoris]|uniref:DUF1806 family protein n=1 Tax=Paenibacillus arenilitoris TaxID=2772299 RepID=A0A927CQA2_9BACL|nr:DUF1806 family protein [Paenibacillus arenilitoris]MBD2869966.1 DUF1806 family protein [Paenibacillus arenilitoris]